MKNGEAVAAFEREFAAYVGAEHAIALCNGTATLHTALVAMGVKPGDRVAVPPLTMASTTIAVLHAGAVPVFVDVEPRTWVMGYTGHARPFAAAVPVDLYGLNAPWLGETTLDDAAQTLRPHGPGSAFTSYSFQASKILPLGEGGMLVTNDEELATRAREFSSLGYRMPDGPRIYPARLKSPTYERHHGLGWNYRMSDLVAREGLEAFSFHVLSPVSNEHVPRIAWLRQERILAAALYRDAISGCDWLTPQHVPDGWTHDYWTYAVAIERVAFQTYSWADIADRIEHYGGARPYAAWRLTYHEPAFRRGQVDVCPVAEDLQPRLMQFQTNDLASAERNAEALSRAIREIGG